MVRALVSVSYDHVRLSPHLPPISHAAKVATSVVSCVRLRVRGLSVIPSLHCTKCKQLSLLVASIVAVLASQSVAVIVAVPPSVAERLTV